MMKHELPMRITVVSPPAGVVFCVQKGRDELLPAAEKSADRSWFDFEINVDLSGLAPNFLGQFAQGPKDARFIYVNSGTLAGQKVSRWTRRAKVPLNGITPEQIENVLKHPGSFLEALIYGKAGDGGPACASVKLLGSGWTVTKK